MMDQLKPPQSKIYRSFVCEKCGAEFKTSEDYKQHKADHMLGKIVDKKLDPVTNEEIPLPFVEEDPPQPNTTPPQPQINIPHVVTPNLPSKSEPITLKYIFYGTCPSCNSPIDTIPLDVELDGVKVKEGITLKQKKFVCIAWCPREKKNVQQRIVAKL